MTSTCASNTPAGSPGTDPSEQGPGPSPSTLRQCQPLSGWGKKNGCGAGRRKARRHPYPRPGLRSESAVWQGSVPTIHTLGDPIASDTFSVKSPATKNQLEPDKEGILCVRIWTTGCLSANGLDGSASPGSGAP